MDTKQSSFSDNLTKMYNKPSLLKKDDFLKEFSINVNGLSSKDAEESITKYGLNQIKQAKPKKWYNYFLASLFSPFNGILMGITLILIYTDVILSSPPSFANIVVILILIITSTLLEFFEEFRSNKAAEKLKELVAATSTVIRNGKETKIPMKEITVGDIIVLSAGDMIPADLRVIDSKDLYVSQSSLTGESDAVKKVVDASKTSIDSITDLDNICFMGTNVISGYAKGVVFAIGENTYFGKVAHTMSTGKPETTFQKGIKSISKLLMRFMLVMIPVAFLLNAWKHDTLVAFTFSVAIAIGITPLLLPVILSSSLAKGAVRMSKKKTIVKKLDSIQSFGAMNILCTDKTGTLTEDNIILEKYLDVQGNENKKILETVFLNSYFQTGLKGNIDEAIIKRAKSEGLTGFTDNYTKIDEIPFDFSRRRLSIIVSNQNNSCKMITKGALEEILSVCKFIDYNGEVTPLAPEKKEFIRKLTKDLNESGLRVVAVAYKDNISSSNGFGVQDENNMVLVGFTGFLDPPKESAKASIEELNKNGIRVIVLTGDNEAVTKCICSKVGINTSRIVTGSKLDKMSDIAVLRILRNTNVFAKLSPIQKARVVRLLKDAGNVVGYMGDGINDAPSLTNSEVGISVDTAVDIAKETADIILLEKDLNVLTQGVREGRKTFGNLLKYIKMAVSFNFGEVLSVLIASMLLPFFPITPIQLLVQSLLYDIGQLTLPFDNVDEEYLGEPQKWNLNSIKNFMFFMGPISSMFDLIVFAILWFGFKLRLPDAALFQTIWFSYGVVSNLVGLHVIRTAKIPIKESNASKMVYFSSITLSIIAIIFPFTFLGKMIGLVALPLKYISVIIIIPLLYVVVAMIVKKDYIRHRGNWI